MGMSSSISPKNCWTTIIDTVSSLEFGDSPGAASARAVRCTEPIAGVGLSIVGLVLLPCIAAGI